MASKSSLTAPTAEAFVKRGFLPDNLPPAYTSEDLWNTFSKHSGNYLVTKAVKGTLSPFSASKRGGQRRLFTVPHPVFIHDAGVFLNKHWSAIEKLLSRSPGSLSVPNFPPAGGRASRITRHSELPKLRLREFSRFRFCAVTDISRCYPSIYTHSIPWSINGRAEAKADIKHNSAKVFGNRLDFIMRQSQDGQTIGISTGTDISRVVAEIVLSGVDHQFLQRYTSEAFPKGSTPNGTSELPVTWNEILWAALTIGRPSVHHVFHHGSPSRYEAMFRLSLVRMALEQSGPTATRLRRTDAFKALDPTEKGAITYFLGMTFCKLFASRLLDTPWLLHLDVYKSHYSASHIGRSRPDLFGQQVRSGAWHSFESKGRSSKPSATDRQKAKSQAQRLVSVGGVACTLHIGSFTYFVGDAVRFHWIDPPADGKRQIEIPEIGDGWRYYYEPARSLWRRSSTEADDGEILITVSSLDLKVRVHSLLAPFFVTRSWADARQKMLRYHDELIADGFQADGLKIECGPSWSIRQSARRQSR